MFKKVTTVISQNKTEILNKALILGGITAGMIISSLLPKNNTEQVIVREEVIDVENPTTDTSPAEEN